MTWRIKPTFKDMSRSTTSGPIPRSVLEVRPAETTSSPSQLEAYLGKEALKNGFQKMNK
jgi:hypothetical protein